MDEDTGTLSAPGTCHHNVLYSLANPHHNVLYSFAEHAPMHVPSSLHDLYEDAELLPLVEHCEWQGTDQSSLNLKGRPSQWLLAGGDPPVQCAAALEDQG